MRPFCNKHGAEMGRNDAVMRRTRRLLSAALLAGLLGLLSSCDIVNTQDASSARPNLGLLKLPEFAQESAPASENPTAGDHLRVDLWLDASQIMGGINPQSDTIYPHSSKKYREGGFHYRDGLTVGWYENVLRAMLGASEGSFARILRSGNERLEDRFLIEQGLASADADAQTLRSLRRDLLTYAIDPLPSVFSDLSGEDMSQSFYALGSPVLNQMKRFLPDDGAALENPGQAQRMSDALDLQIAGIAQGGAAGAPYVMQQGRDDCESPLYYALENLDTSRLSVITVDPLALRRLSGISGDGSLQRYYHALLEERGIFDQGLCVGLYAFELDYMGQIASIGPAGLREPIIWGKPLMNSKTRLLEGLAPMPRTLLTLVIGTAEQTAQFTQAFNARLAADSALSQLRGPAEGQLTYTQNGQTITQQPFPFAYYYTLFSRPGAGFYTQDTPGTALTAENGDVQQAGSLATVSVRPDADGFYSDQTLTLRIPLQLQQDSAQLELSALKDVSVEVQSALLLAEERPNTPEAPRLPAQGEQILALRDRLYLFRQKELPFADGSAASPFAVTDAQVAQDGKELVFSLSVNGTLLTQGHYRLFLSADIAQGAVTWPSIDWIDSDATLSGAVTNEDIVAWETFSQTIHDRERKSKYIPKQFQHAWGSYTERPYAGLTIPDCPPVGKAVGLLELAEQLRGAAATEQAPLVRYVLDVFVDNRPEGAR